MEEKHCCSNQKEEHSCCSGKHKEHECCSNNHNEEHSCCSAKESESSCCAGKHEEQSCCSTQKNESSCCCHSKEDESSCGCCGGKKETGKKTAVVLIVSLVSLITSFFVHIPLLDPAFIAVILCGMDIFKSAFSSIKRRKISTPILISVAMIASIALEFFYVFTSAEGHSHGTSYIFAAGEIAFLMYLGQALEERTVRKSSEGIKKLASLLPEKAVVEKDGKLVEISASEIKVGDIVVVNPSEKIPADGIVIAGKSAVDNSMLTGESAILDIEEGIEVFAGTWNGYGAIKVKVTKPEADMAVVRLIELTKEAQGKKAPISRVADKWAAILVPTAALLSVLVFIFAFLILKVPMTDSIVRAVSVLVVFCPCALTLATPTAISAAIGAFSKQGVLVKSGAAIELLAKTKNVAFDKTGTLTKGNLEIANVKCLIDTEDELFDYLKTAENASEHPVARAIKGYPKGVAKSSEEVVQKSGVGVSCITNDEKITVAKISEFNEIDEDAILWAQEGKTVIGISRDDRMIGYVALSDTIRAETKDVINALKKEKIKSFMLTGDNKETAFYIAEKAGVENVNYALLPHHKTEITETLKQSGTTVFVGDGINDTPALATADVGISMSVLGSDIATHNSDVALFTEDLKVIPWLLLSSKRVLYTIKGNIAIAMTINALAILLSALGVLNPVTGAVLHNCTSVFVVGNSARLLSIKRK